MSVSPTKLPILSPRASRKRKTAETALSDIRVHGDVAYVTLTQGYVATIDRADVERVGQHNWYALPRRHTVYACARLKGGGNDRIWMHRLVAERDGEMEIDHRDGNGLNNRRRNLRPVTKAQQMMNRTSRGSGNNVYRGVFWVPSREKWVAKASIAGKIRYIGHYETEPEAARAYQYVARRLRGEFYRNSLLDLPDDGERIRISPLVRGLILKIPASRLKPSHTTELSRCTGRAV